MIQTVVVALPPPRLVPEHNAELALPFARAVANRTGADVVLVSVVDPLTQFQSQTSAAPVAGGETEIAREVRAHLEQLAGSFPASNVEIVVRVGSAPAEILEVVAGRPEPLLVVTSHARAGLGRLFVGSVAFDLVRMAPCPVLVVRGPHPAATPAGIPALSKIVTPLDLSPFSEYAITAGLAALGPADLHLHLVHVIQPMAHPGIARNEVVDIVEPQARACLRETAQSLIARGYRVTIEVRTGRPVEEIVRAVEEQGADLIAMTTHGRGGLGRVFIGSVAERLLRASPAPLLLIRPPEAALVKLEAEQRDAEVWRWRERIAMPPALWKLQVRDLMVQPLFVAHEETPLVDVVRMMLEQGIGCVPVVDDHGDLAGILTESDFIGDSSGIPLAAYQVPQLFREGISQEAIEHVYHAGREITAGEIMSRHLITIGENDPVCALVRLMLGRDVNQVLVERDGAPVGIVSRRELLNLLSPPER